MLDLLDICSRILKLEELKKQKVQDVKGNSWPALIEDENSEWNERGKKGGY